MAGSTDTLRGDGLVRAHIALARLEGDSLRLDRERQRFSHSPPLYTSNPSTRSASPNDPSEEQRRRCRTRSVTPSAALSEEQRLREERRVQLWGEREASEPDKQFSVQVQEERRRIWNTHPRTSGRELTLADVYTFMEEARETVKRRWVEQGIWNSKWDYYNIGRWKHEEPLELESESETDSKAGPSSPLFSSSPKPQPKLRLPKSDDEVRRIAERRVTRQREREASRPYHQFIYQISVERERIQEDSENGEGVDGTDIYTRAYENVKNTWIRREIWNVRWGILPGTSWKHEEPLEEEAADGPALVLASPLANGRHEAREAPADIESTGLEIGDAGRSSPTSNSPLPSSGKRATTQARLPSKGKAIYKDGQLANASLGPVNSSKLSKSAGKRKRPQRRLNNPQMDTLAFLLGADVAEPQPSPPPDRETPRRSKRTQLPVSGVARDSTKMGSMDPSKRALR